MNYCCRLGCILGIVVMLKVEDLICSLTNFKNVLIRCWSIMPSVLNIGCLQKITCFQISKVQCWYFVRNFYHARKWFLSVEHTPMNLCVTAKSRSSGMPTVTCLTPFDDCIDDGRNMFCAPPANAEEMNHNFTFWKQAHSIAPTPWSLPSFTHAILLDQAFMSVLNSVFFFHFDGMVWWICLITNLWNSKLQRCIPLSFIFKFSNLCLGADSRMI